MNITRATLGFIFSPDLKHVLLIHKNRPVFQAGKINGIGGKCNEGESFADCISREVWEETELRIPPEAWKSVGYLTFPDWEIEVFTATLIDQSQTPTSLTDEEVEWHSVKNLPAACISNLHWLIPMSLDTIKRSNEYNFHFSTEHTN